jgi:hypothetical protein
LIQKYLIFFSAVFFYQFLVIKARIRDPDPESGSAIRKNAGSVSGSALNQCGSETLAGNQVYFDQFSGFWIRILIPNAVPDPGEPNKC